jgi:hypothetical protein
VLSNVPVGVSSQPAMVMVMFVREWGRRVGERCLGCRVCERLAKVMPKEKLDEGVSCFFVREELFLASGGGQSL